MHIELSREQVFDIMVEHDVLGADTYEATRALVEYLSASEVWDIDTSGYHRQDRDEFILEYLQDRTTVIIVDETTVIVEEF